MNNLFKNRKFIAFIIFTAYLITGILTLKNYWISWDEPVHFRRGQAYLWYFLTSEKDYRNLNSERKSLYQVEDIYRSGKHPKDYDMGHPPTADIASALTNYVFYQKLGIMGDIESYHLFGVFISAMAVTFIFMFVSSQFGILSGIISSLIFATYPLFWGESHFNIKDPAETAFIVMSLYYFWNGIRDNKKILIVASSLFAGLAMGVKFNILFLAPIYLWIIFKNKIKDKPVWITVLLFPLIMYLVFFLLWPYLWADPIVRTLQVFKYYEKIGTGFSYQSNFIYGIFNFYPTMWILITTPVHILILFAIGIYVLIKSNNTKRNLLILALLWLGIVIGRVTLARFSIYGGVRQIMEFIPPLAIITGVGMGFLLKKIKNVYSKIILIFLLTFLSVYPLVKLHPHENLYFNLVIGGLKGAINKNVPAAGNTFGNAYGQGVEWINTNTPKNSRLGLIQGAMANLPLYKIRPDILYDNKSFSGIDRDGEYIMEVVYNQEINSYHYVWEYLRKFLKPVYEVKIDDMPVLSIWKNDSGPEEIEYFGKVSNKLDNNNNLVISFEKPISLSRITLKSYTVNCKKLNGYIEISENGKNWIRKGDAIPSEQVGRRINFENATLEYFFAGDNAKYLKIVGDDGSCFNSPNFPFAIRVYQLIV